MNHIIAFIKAHLALGWLGIVLLLMAGIVIAAGFFPQNNSIDSAMNRLDALTLLENDVQDELDWMKLNEAYFVFSLLYDEQSNGEYLAEVTAAHAEMAASIQALRDEYFRPGVDYSAQSLDLMEGFDRLRIAHQSSFQTLVDASSVGASAADIQSQYIAAEAEYDAIDDQLSLMIQTLEEERLQYLQRFPSEVTRSILVFSGGILAVILLGLWGYRLLYRYTEPLPILRNAVLAISGDCYRPELLVDLIRKPGPAGEAARSLHALGTYRQAHEKSQKDEIERLRQELYESRRKRLRIWRGSENKEVAK